MSIINAVFNKAYGYEDAFKAVDCSSSDMKKAIDLWFRLFYDNTRNDDYDTCQRIPYTVVNKITKTAFGEYQATGADDFAQSVIDSLNIHSMKMMQDALIGGVAYIKPFPMGDRFGFSSIARGNVLIFGKDIDGNATDIGTAEKTVYGNAYYTLLERRTIGQDGRLTIKNMLYRSQSDGVLGSRVPLSSLPRYEALQDEYTYTEPIGLGVVPLKTPLANNVDGSTDPVSVYSAAAGMIFNINRNEALLNGEFERGQSRIVVSNDMLEREERTIGSEKYTRKCLKDNVFVGMNDDPESVGITIFSPTLREASFLARKTEYLRNVESIIGLKRGMLSEVEAVDKTATEVTSSAGDFNLTIIDFQKMWERAAKETAVLCGKLGKLYGVTGAHDLTEDDISIDWGNGVLYDEDKMWEDYKDQVARGLIKPEIALGWRYNMPADTPNDLQKIREKYMPEIDSLMQGAGYAET